jgi:hypothetical protein
VAKTPRQGETLPMTMLRIVVLSVGAVVLIPFTVCVVIVRVQEAREARSR